MAVWDAWSLSTGERLKRFGPLVSCGAVSSFRFFASLFAADVVLLHSSFVRVDVRAHPGLGLSDACLICVVFCRVPASYLTL